MTEKERKAKLALIADMLGDWRPCQFGEFEHDCEDVCCKEKDNGYCDTADCWLKILQKLTKNS